MHYGMKTYGEWKYSYIILDLGTTVEVNGQLHVLAALLLGKEPR
jgi:hypothetical protein